MKPCCINKQPKLRSHIGLSLELQADDVKLADRAKLTLLEALSLEWTDYYMQARVLL